MDSTFYTRQHRALLRRYDFFARRARPHLETHLDAEQVAALLLRARDRYEELIPGLPFIGGWSNSFTPVMEINGWIVALYQEGLSDGLDARAVIEVCGAVTDELFRRLPAWVRSSVRRVLEGGMTRRHFQKQARATQLRRHPDDFVYEVEDNADGGFDLVFTECAVNKYYARMDVPELGPYCNFFDITYGRHLGLGVDASETLGLGCERCRLSYRPGRDTVTPPSLEGVLPG